jgi:hypothetical protein
MKTTTPQARRLLEGLIDSHGLSSVLEMVSEVCEDKGDHIRADWQDEVLANQWETAGMRVYRAAERVRKVLP